MNPGRRGNPAQKRRRVELTEDGARNAASRLYAGRENPLRQYPIAFSLILPLPWVNPRGAMLSRRAGLPYFLPRRGEFFPIRPPVSFSSLAPCKNSGSVLICVYFFALLMPSVRWENGAVCQNVFFRNYPVPYTFCIKNPPRPMPPGRIS